MNNYHDRDIDITEYFWKLEMTCNKFKNSQIAEVLRFRMDLKCSTVLILLYYFLITVIDITVVKNIAIINKI